MKTPFKKITHSTSEKRPELNRLSECAPNVTGLAYLKQCLVRSSTALQTKSRPPDKHSADATLMTQHPEKLEDESCRKNITGPT